MIEAEISITAVSGDDIELVFEKGDDRLEVILSLKEAEILVKYLMRAIGIAEKVRSK
jgi:hypothetical protein